MDQSAHLWDRLDPKYRLILCDIWGVIHDGARLYPGAAERLSRWRREGRTVVLLTNAPRTADVVEQQLGKLGLSEDAWDAIETSGEAGIAALTALGEPVGFIGTRMDRATLESRAVPIAEDGHFRHVAATGFGDGRWDVADLEDDLRRWAERGVKLHCLNPDRVVVHRGQRLPCAGLIADAYELLGGSVEWYGKPFRPIYEHALRLGGSPAPEEVLAVGDGLHTDVLGAARMGFDAVYVTGGISEGEGIPPNFAEQHGLKDWAPLAVVGSLE